MPHEVHCYLLQLLNVLGKAIQGENIMLNTTFQLDTVACQSLMIISISLIGVGNLHMDQNKHKHMATTCQNTGNQEIVRHNLISWFSEFVKFDTRQPLYLFHV